MTAKTENSSDSRITMTLTRRGFVKMGGALFVSLSIPGGLSLHAAESPTSLDPSVLASWLEIHSDNTILARTGRTETGTGMSAYYAQAISEELCVRPETISLVLGDTDRTPDGGASAGFLDGMANVRKVAAYTHQALLGLAATQLGVPVSKLTVVDAVVSGGGKSISYGQLVQGQQLDLKIPVTGMRAKVDPSSPEGNGLAGLDGFTVTGDPPTLRSH
jgi:nicotinate dehydrogenase subunit B